MLFIISFVGCIVCLCVNVWYAKRKQKIDYSEMERGYLTYAEEAEKKQVTKCFWIWIVAAYVFLFVWLWCMFSVYV